MIPSRTRQDGGPCISLAADAALPLPFLLLLLALCQVGAGGGDGWEELCTQRQIHVSEMGRGPASGTRHLRGDTTASYRLPPSGACQRGRVPAAHSASGLRVIPATLGHGRWSGERFLARLFSAW